MIAIVTAIPEELAPLLREIKVERRLRIGKRRCSIGMLHSIPVAVMATGDGNEQAETSLRELLQRVKVDSVIAIGIAGALSPELKPGEIVRVISCVGAGPLAGTLPAEGLAATRDSEPGSGVGAGPLAGTLPAEGLAATRDVTVVTANKIAATAAAKRAVHKEHPEAAAIDTDSLGWARAASAAGVPISIYRLIFDTVDEDLPPIVAELDRVKIVRNALLHPTVIPDLLRLRNRIRRSAEQIARFITDLVAGPADALEKWLQETSRTFALCIPLLPQPTRLEVTLAYLLFRIADTFEDATAWPAPMRMQALHDFCDLLRDPDPARAARLTAEWQKEHPIEHAGYIDLLAHVPAVLDAFRALSPEAREIIRSHVIRSAEGMSGWVSRTSPEGNLRLADLDDLRRYCYTVAGIVGEMLTELFLLGAPALEPVAGALRERAATFGEALQLVNILKDAASDRSEGRTYIPSGIPIGEVFALARKDLDVATDYTLRMQRQGAPRGIVAFCALPVALARATVDRVEKFGPGAKVSRPEVFRIVRRLDRSLDANKPALSVRS